MSFSSEVKQELRKQSCKKKHCAAVEMMAISWCDPKTSANMAPPYLEKTCCKRAFIRGAFLEAGSITDPNKSYHFEIVCKTMEQAEFLQNTIREGFGLHAKIVERKEHFVVYIKEGEEIVEMLNIMEAFVSLMNLENIRILKEMRNSINRKVNCETANLMKTVNSATRQIQDIEYIRDSIGIDALPKNLQEVAWVRLENPNVTLKELGELMDPPVGKSGINHRLRKIERIVQELKGEK